MAIDINNQLDKIHEEIDSILTKYGKTKADRDLLLGMAKLAVATINSGTVKFASPEYWNADFALKLMKLCTMMEQTIADVEREPK